MFGIIADLIASVTTILLPAYLSYKSLRSGDPATTTPWLIYFIMLSLSLLFESWTVFVLGWMPFYSWIRLFYLLYLVLPQTQGAKYLYLEYVEPYIVSHETRIDKFIGEAHYKLESLGLGYLAFVVDYLREKILGQASPSPPSAQSSQGRTSAPGYGSAAVSSYASDLLSRFAMPAARSQSAQYPSAGAAPPGTSLSSFLTSALASASGATTQTSSTTATRSTPLSDPHGTFSGSAIPDLSTIQSYLNNPTTSNSQKSDIIQSQRDRLSSLMKALDREQQTLDLAYGSTGGRPTSRSGGGLGQKSRSEQSFENVSYEDVVPSGGDHTPTRNSPPSQRGSAERQGSGKRTTSGGGWGSGWFGGASSPPSGSTKGKGGIDGREGEDLVSRGWSAAREMTEEVLRERGGR